MQSVRAQCRGVVLTLALAFAFALSCAAVVAPPGPYVEGDVLVTFGETVTLGAAKQMLTDHSLALVKHFAFLSEHRHKQTFLARGSGRTTARLIAELSPKPTVETVEPNHLRRAFGATPNDPLFGQLWGLRNTGQSVNGVPGTAGADIKFAAAWAMSRPATNHPAVAVIDTGVDYAHPDLAANLWTNTAEMPGNGVDDDTNGYVDDVVGYDFLADTPDPSDSGKHGTHVAGTVAAVGNNQTGVIGVNFQARIMALKTSNDGDWLDDAAIIEAIQYATMMKTRGVPVVAINASFGDAAYSGTERSAIEMAGSAGIVFCAAAGNSSLDHDFTPNYPASYRLPNMIVVAASGQADTLASFSDYGATTVDLAAPGVNIESTLPLNRAGTIAYAQQGPTTYAANALTYSGITTGITATAYSCGLGYPADFPPAVSNNIAVIQRGTLFFSEKVANAMAAGAAAVIIYNNVAGNFNGTLQSPGNWIPAIAISQADGQTLVGTLPTTATAVNAPDPGQIYQLMNGTSMATPHVAGAVAFAAMQFPGETVAQRIQRILAHVDVLPALQGRVITSGRLNLLRTVDTDTNGLPDWWEQSFFGQWTGVAPGADADQDGLTNLGEWLAGTNPTNAASGLWLNALPADGTNSFAVSWPSVAGKFYRFERATNLLTGFDFVIATNIAATPPLNVGHDTASPPGEARFYRLRLEP